MEKGRIADFRYMQDTLICGCIRSHRNQAAPPLVSICWEGLKIDVSRRIPLEQAGDCLDIRRWLTRTRPIGLFPETDLEDDHSATKTSAEINQTPEEGTSNESPSSPSGES